MKKVLALVLIIVTFPSFAQQPPSQEFILKLTMAEIQLIGAVLVERPYKDVAALLGKLNTQVTAQQIAPPAAEPPKPPTQP